MQKSTLPFIIVFACVSCTMMKLPDGVELRKPDEEFIDLDFSPDDRELVGTVFNPAYLFGEPSYNVSTWDLNTDAIQRISGFSNLFSDFSPRWHPSDDVILFSSNSNFDRDNLGLLNLETGEKQGLADTASAWDWVPDGREIIFGDTGSLFSLSLDTHSLQRLINFNSKPEIVGIAVKPTGDSIGVILKEPNTQRPDWRIEIYEDKSEATIFESEHKLSNLDWSPGGIWLSFVSNEQDFLGARAFNFNRKCLTDFLPISGDIVDLEWAHGGNTVLALSRDDRELTAYFIHQDSKFFTDWLNSGDCRF